MSYSDPFGTLGAAAEFWESCFLFWEREVAFVLWEYHRDLSRENECHTSGHAGGRAGMPLISLLSFTGTIHSDWSAVFTAFDVGTFVCL